MRTALFSRRAGLLACIALAAGARAEARDPRTLAQTVNEAVQPVMERYGVPGMAVALTVQGERHFFNLGVASTEGAPRVDEHTLFEIGSISKTFTALLAAYAQERGALKLEDPASRHWPALAGSAFDRISLLELGTYSAGGLPLQFPAHVNDDAAMLAYYRAWRPDFAPGTHRRYSNPSLGLFGHLAAKALQEEFTAAMQVRLLPLLGLRETFLRVPPSRMPAYAWGHAQDGRRIRVGPGVFDAQGYGIKTTASDLMRFLEANMDGTSLEAQLQRAIALTHHPRFRVGAMEQALGWEVYRWPAGVEALLAGNSNAMAFEPHPVTRPASLVAQKDVLFNKTGSTNGFGAYVAFVPSRRIGIVMLANRNHPIAERVRAAHRILLALDAERR